MVYVVVVSANSAGVEFAFPEGNFNSRCKIRFPEGNLDGI
jgi:hypothetical protein